MATEWGDWTAEELLDSYWQAEAANANGGWTRDPSELRAELLRRLSAGNPQTHCDGCTTVHGPHAPQAEKVQISDNGRYAPCGCPACPNVRYDYGQLKPERSDGRIQGGSVRVEWDTHFCAVSGCEHGRSGEQRETRIQGETLAMCASGPCGRNAVIEASIYCCVPCYYREGPHDAACDEREAQRSAGRIEAGSEQGSAGVAEDPRDYDVDRLPRGV